MANKGKVLALRIASLGVIVLVSAGFMVKERLLERWYLWRLEKGSEAEQFVVAGKLGDMRSMLAVPVLIEVLQKDPHKYFHGCGDPRSQPLRRALVEVGKPATLTILKAWEEFPGVGLCYFFILVDIYGWPKEAHDPEDGHFWRPDLFLLWLSNVYAQCPEVRQVASKILKTLK